MNNEICITLVTLESHNHIVGDIDRGIKIYERGGIDIIEQEPGFYIARVPHKSDMKTVSIRFTSDGEDIEHHHCDCCWRSGNPICRHKVAAIFAIQGGIPKSNLELGKSYWFDYCISDKDTAKAVGIGDLDALANTVMIKLMEYAAYMLLEDTLEEGQISICTNTNVSHTSASPVGIMIEIEAKIISVRGHSIIIEVSASDEAGEIGKGTHTRYIVDEEEYLKELQRKVNQLR